MYSINFIQLTDLNEIGIPSWLVGPMPSTFFCCCCCWCCCVDVILLAPSILQLSLVSLLNSLLVEMTGITYYFTPKTWQKLQSKFTSYLFHLMYIMKVWFQFWMLLISPWVMVNYDSCQIVRLYAQQLSYMEENWWVFTLLSIVEIDMERTFSLSIIWKLCRLMFRCGNCVPTTALDNWCLIWLVTVIRRWPRWRCDSSVRNFPSRWRWRFKLNRSKFPFNNRWLWCWFWSPNWCRWWIWLSFLYVERVFRSIAFRPNA